MRLATPPKASPAKTEQIILFRVSGQLFAISSSSVQEVRSADSISGAATNISAPGVRKVRHVLRRGDRSLFIVNGAMHFGLHMAEGAQLFVLRKTRTALLIDGIEKMTTMTRLQALPLSFCHEERQRSEEHTSELQSRLHLVCRLLLEKKKNKDSNTHMR